MRSFACLLLAVLPVAAQSRQDVNYSETAVPSYTLPDPLTFAAGGRVTTAQAWNSRRRPEILELFRANVYGRSPGRAPGTRFETVAVERNVLGGAATRKLVAITFGRQDGPRLDLLLYLPARARGPVPVFLGLNFGGNHTVAADPGIPLKDPWEEKTRARRKATEEARGASASQWQVEKILSRGYGLATMYYGDIEPDFDGGLAHGVRALFLRPGQTPGPDDWGAIGAWAWGLSRALDYLETDRDVDAGRVALMGHSRLGKTALWAGAQDDRFALVISNDSGEGGAALARRRFGERVHHLNQRFPHWFCANYRRFNQREDDLPVDQHLLLALIAPRPLYVASAEQDQWADPRGEFLSAVNAGPVYALLGKKGLGTDAMPAVHQPIQNDIAYHIRAGRHDVTLYDWERYLDFTGRRLARR